MPMRPLTALAAVGLVLLVLTGCGAPQVDLSDYPWELEVCEETFENSEEHVSLRFEDGSLTPEGATVILENTGDEDFDYGHGYHIYLKANGKLYRLPFPENYGWTAELLTVPAHSSVTTDCTWSGIYGALPPGEYLYVMDSDLAYIYCLVYEFEIS